MMKRRIRKKRMIKPFKSNQVILFTSTAIKLIFHLDSKFEHDHSFVQNFDSVRDLFQVEKFSLIHRRN